LIRKPRRSGPTAKVDKPPSPHAAERNRAALRAYRLCLIGIIPGPGLLLGPVALVLGGLAWYRGKGDPGFTAINSARACVWLGLAIGLTNWIGLILMILGWRE
jgi:hypothetical protein